jgi:hypothetical protein
MHFLVCSKKNPDLNELNYLILGNIRPTIKWQKSNLHCRKKPKIDLREITGVPKFRKLKGLADVTFGELRLQCSRLYNPWVIMNKQ